MRLQDFNLFYLNLAKRPERLQAIQTQLDRLGLLQGAQLVVATDGQNLDDPPEILEEQIRRFKTMARRRERILGRIGCLRSHLRILETAVRKGLDNLLVVEDDCVFHPDLAADWEFQPPEDADILYFGGLFWRQEPEDQLQTGDWVRIRRKNLKLATTICYAIIGADRIRRIWETVRDARPSAIDLLYINQIQNQGNCYVVNPVVCQQSDQFLSDVSNYGETTPTKPYRNGYSYLAT